MAMLSNHRKCGCDCRDENTFTVDPNTFNPLCCVDVNGAKPPCSFRLQWECTFGCGGDVWGIPGQILRPVCTFIDSCKYVDAAAGSPETSFLDSCTWIQRSGYLGARFEFLAVNWWTLDVSTGPVTLTHRLGYAYQQKRGDVWNSHGPNTLWLVGPRGSVGTSPPPDPCRDKLPKWVCVVPGLTLAIPTDMSCCTNCFGMSYPDYNATALQLPAQQLTFLPSTSSFITQGGEQIHAACGYRAPIISSGSLTGTGTMTFWVLSPIRDGSPSQAIMEVVYYFGIFLGTHNRSELRIAHYECTSFTCANGGFFTLSTGDPLLPPVLTVTPQLCVRSDNGDYGVCPHCSGEEFTRDGLSAVPILPGNGQDFYANEEARCACQDEWCECLPGGVKLFYSDGSSITSTACAQQSIDASPILGFCKNGLTIQGHSSGPIRDMSVGTVNVRVYCDDGAWQAEWYCSGSYVATTGINISSTCPIKGVGGAPPMPDCGIVGGCLNINCPACLICEYVPPCCPDPIGVLNVHMTTTIDGCGCASSYDFTISEAAAGGDGSCPGVPFSTANRWATDPGGITYCGDKSVSLFLKCTPGGYVLELDGGAQCTGADVSLACATSPNNLDCPSVFLEFNNIELCGFDAFGVNCRLSFTITD